MSHAAGRQRILLVEDNPDDAELALRAFRQSGVDVEISVARDGVDALRRLTAADVDLPDLVLLDIKIPLLGGLEVLRRLRADARAASIPVVVLSTSSEENDISTAYRLGANSYLRKPVDYQTFTGNVRALAHYWLELNVPPQTGGAAR